MKKSIGKSDNPDMHVEVKIKREPGCEDLQLPAYQTTGSAGFDLPAAVEDSVILLPGEIKLIPAGFRMSVPPGYEGQVRPRSGLAINHGIGILNSPGTVDSDYRGVVGVILFNFGQKPFTIHRGDRIAQMVITKVEYVSIVETEILDSSQREVGGFGSTGIN